MQSGIGTFGRCGHRVGRGPAAGRLPCGSQGTNTDAPDWQLGGKGVRAVGVVREGPGPTVLSGGRSGPRSLHGHSDRPCPYPFPSEQERLKFSGSLKTPSSLV